MRRLEALNTKQREIQTIRYKKYMGTGCEVMVEGRNDARAQWIGRTSHNKTLNFTAPERVNLKAGDYVPGSQLRAVFPTVCWDKLVV